MVNGNYVVLRSVLYVLKADTSSVEVNWLNRLFVVYFKEAVRNLHA